jgi:hypothetical protein
MTRRQRAEWFAAWAVLVIVGCALVVCWVVW